MKPRLNIQPQSTQSQRPEMRQRAETALRAKRANVLELSSSDLIEQMRAEGALEESGDDWEVDSIDDNSDHTGAVSHQSGPGLQPSSIDDWLVAESPGASELQEEILDLLSPISSALAMVVGDAVDPETGLIDSSIEELQTILRSEYGETWSTNRLVSVLHTLATQTHGNIATSRDQRLSVRVAAMDPDSLVARVYQIIRENFAKDGSTPDPTTMARQLGVDTIKIKEAQRQLANLVRHASTSNNWESLLQSRPDAADSLLPVHAAQPELLLERLGRENWVTSVNHQALPRFREIEANVNQQDRGRRPSANPASINLHDYDTRNAFLLATARTLVTEQIDFLEGLWEYLSARTLISRLLDSSGQGLPPRLLALRKAVSFADSTFQSRVATLCDTPVTPDRTILSRAVKDRCMLLATDGTIVPLELLVVAKSATVGGGARPSVSGVDELLGIPSGKRMLASVTSDTARVRLFEILAWSCPRALTQDAITIIMYALGTPVSRSWVKKELQSRKDDSMSRQHAGRGRELAWNLAAIRTLIASQAVNYDPTRLGEAWEEYERKTEEQRIRTRATRSKSGSQ